MNQPPPRPWGEMIRTNLRVLSSVPIALILLASGCAPGFPAVMPVDPNPPPGFQWLACPGGAPTEIARGTIGPAGGTLTHSSGHVLTVPPNAVSSNRTFTLHEPASTHVQVVATVSGNVAFEVPISLTISFDRCPPGTPATGMEVFRVNPGGRHDPLGGQLEGPRAIRSDQLNRLSLYALATN